MGKHRPRGIELSAVQEESVAAGRETRLKFKDGFGPTLDKGIPKAVALQHALEKELLLLLGAIQSDGFDHIVMVLGNLAQRRICGGDDGHDLGRGRERHFRSAVCFRNSDTPEAALREFVQFFMRQAALAVALGRFLLKTLGETAGNGQGFLLVANNVGRSLNPRHWRGDPNSLIRRSGGL